MRYVGRQRLCEQILSILDQTCSSPKGEDFCRDSVEQVEAFGAGVKFASGDRQSSLEFTRSSLTDHGEPYEQYHRYKRSCLRHGDSRRYRRGAHRARWTDIFLLQFQMQRQIRQESGAIPAQPSGKAEQWSGLLQLNPYVDETLCSSTDALDQIVATARKGIL